MTKFRKFNKVSQSQMTQGYFENIKKNDQLFVESKNVKYPVLEAEVYKRSQQYFIGIV